MRRKSHLYLGCYLADRYLSHLPERAIRAFLFGCTEPDRNPATYLKGSFRFQWLRGHNYPNARRFMARLSRRLEGKRTWSLLDYYALGKLVHYTADAFTQAHNDFFSPDLEAHRTYEADLQAYFLNFLRQEPPVEPKTAASVMDAIEQFHGLYRLHPAGPATDSRFALSACCCMIPMLLTH